MGLVPDPKVSGDPQWGGRWQMSPGGPDQKALNHTLSHYGFSPYPSGILLVTLQTLMPAT
jgi:hypothetical protein